MINDINPPAIVRSMHDEKTAREWHEQGLAAEIKRSAGTLEQAESWYHLKEGAGYQELGYQSIAEYVFKEFGKSAATCDKYIQIYRVMCVDLKKDMTDLAAIGAGKLSKVVGHVDEENVDQVLSDIKNMSQKQIDERIKQEKPIETPDEDSDREEQKTLRMKGPASMVDVIEDATRAAKGEIVNMSSFNTVDDIPDLYAMNYIMSCFMSSVSLEGNPVSTLENSISSLEGAYGVTIDWKEGKRDLNV
jgi:hypothetical protein